MTRELITHWTDYQAAIDQLLAMPCRKLSIYDEDLLKIRLDDRKRLGNLQRLLQSAQPGSIRIALRNAEPLRRTQTHLIQLLAGYSHIITIQETSQQLNRLRDSMILLDEQHGLIRFDQDQARSKLLINESDELRPYLQRFEEIWKEPGNVVSSTSLGL
jgi:hypothetical protein